MSDAKSPADFLKSIKGQKVLVKLNSGVDYRGIMSSLDGYMNIAMEQTEVRGRDDLERPRGSARFGWSPPRARVGVACASRVTPRSDATREPVREPATRPRAIASSTLRSRSKGTLVGFLFSTRGVARFRAFSPTDDSTTTRFMSSRVTGSIDGAQNEGLRVLF
jgi:small nuclear ribonucleoprotein (snRNP)-like protein